MIGDYIHKTFEAMKFSLEDKGYWVDLNEGKLFNKHGKELGSVDKEGYTTIALPHPSDGRFMKIYLHKVLAYCLWGEKAFGSQKEVQVRHLDGNNSNNKRENLALGTSKENAMDIPKEIRSKATKEVWTNRTTKERKTIGNKISSSIDAQERENRAKRMSEARKSGRIVSPGNTSYHPCKKKI